jgi:cell division protein FtsI (penicillin-binding protein 3)
VAAKTGTAQIFNTSTGQYSDDEFIASCLAVVPAENPQLILYVVINNPKAGEFYGGRIAAPVISTLVDRTVSYLGIPRASDRVLEHDGTVEVTSLPELSIDDVVPDFTGYSKRQLLPLLKGNNIKLRIVGEGWVVDQTPAPGTRFAPGMSITVELE